jgi:hypothetical protein
MLHQVDDALLRAMSGIELSRVRTELRLLPPEPINKRLIASRGADIVMQSSGFWSNIALWHLPGYRCRFKRSMQHLLIS